MTKFHINNKGLPAPCKAEDGNCPFGGEESHYNSEYEAQIKADEIAGEEFGLLGIIDTEENDELKIDDTENKMDKIKNELAELTSKMNSHVKSVIEDVEVWLEETEEI